MKSLLSISAVFEVAGSAAIVAGIWQMNSAAGLIVLGALLVFVGYSLDGLGDDR